MTNPAGESNDGALRLDFDRRVMLQFRGSVVTSDAGLLAYRELDDVLGLSALASDVLADPRTGRNGRHALVFQERKHSEQVRHDQNAAIAILNIGRMDDGMKQQAQCVYKNMPLLTLDFFARIIAVRIDAGPPFSALLTL